jgi:hypothetical protein
MNDQARQPDPSDAQEPRDLYHGPRGTSVKILNRVDRTDSYLDKLLDVELKSDRKSVV